MAKIKRADLDGIYNFMAQAYQGNWQPRFQDTPYMQALEDEGKIESILSHQWSCMALWFQTRRLCPNLNLLVNSEVLYEILLHHDLGETYTGDVSMVKQIKGHGANKYTLERQEIAKITKQLPPVIQKELLHLFDLFETRPEKTKKLEVLVAKFLDTLQGDHFALTFGNDLPKHSVMINKIVNKKFVTYAKQLMDFLKEKGHLKAKEEVQQITNHHLIQIKAAGIQIK